MPLYAFEAVRPSGEPVSAQVEAANEAEAIERVRDQGLILLRMQTAASAAMASHEQRRRSSLFGRLFASKKVKRDQIIAFTLSLIHI